MDRNLAKDTVVLLEVALNNINRQVVPEELKPFLLKASNDIWDAQFQLNKFIEQSKGQ